MTIDEAIEHAKEIANTCDDRQCAADHAQLAEWLRQARGADKAARWYTEKIRKFKEENARLRTQLADVTESMGRVEERCAKLRELVCEVWRSCPVDEDDCKKCPHYIVESDEVWCDIPIRMHELGIEMDE